MDLWMLKEKAPSANGSHTKEKWQNKKRSKQKTGKDFVNDVSFIEDTNIDSMCSCEGPVFGDWIYAGALWADDYRSPPQQKRWT